MAGESAHASQVATHARREISFLQAAAHRQTWPRGRAAAHARFPHARPLMETTTFHLVT